MILVLNSDYFPMQHKAIGLHSGSTLWSVWGINFNSTNNLRYFSFQRVTMPGSKGTSRLKHTCWKRLENGNLLILRKGMFNAQPRRQNLVSTKISSTKGRHYESACCNK